MRKIARRVAWTAAVLLWVLPLSASAQMREFTGRIDQISATKMIVDNRMGDKVSFMKLDETVVRGEKTTWTSIKKQDWVTVSWKFVDKPRKAYAVKVLPPKKDAADDE